MNTKTAHIICDRYLSPDGSNITIGGMQSYFTSLSEILKDEGYNVNIYHIADANFKKRYKYVTVYGLKWNGPKHKRPKALLKEVKKNARIKQDLIIFGSEMWIANAPGYRCIAIQHGIPWDIPAHYNFGGIKYWLYYIKKAYNAYKNIQKVNSVSHLVCVDYNYINWYRALVAYPKVNLCCIPNFSVIPQNTIQKTKDNINIIFARRLWQYRGTRVFGNAISKILSEYPNVFVTVAGDGPDENWLKNKLTIFENVEFIKYSSEESISIHSDKHIAVVPTIGSEGTSLSLIEAMASKCAVICTDVGGLTNVVIDGFNGLIIPSGDEQALYDSIKKLIEDHNLRTHISENGFKTINSSFSYNKWSEAWKKILNSIESST